MTAAELFGECTLVPHLLLELADVIEIVGERSVDIRQSDRGHMGDDLVGSHSIVLMPDDDVEHTNTVTSDTGFAAADAGCLRDPVCARRGHYSSIEPMP